MKRWKCMLSSALRDARWQLLIAGSAAAAHALWLAPPVLGVAREQVVEAGVSSLSVIGTAIALLGSVSFVFTTYQAAQANTRKRDLFHRFKEALFSFDDFLVTKGSTEPLVAEAEELSWHLKLLDLDEFPIRDWDNRVAGVVAAIDARDSNESDDPNLGNRVLGHLSYVEQLVNQIGLACIHQIALGVYAKVAIKTLGVLGMLVVTLVVITTTEVLPRSLVFTAPAFFGVITVLMLYEIGWWLYRESEEPLTFVEGRGGGGESAEDSGQ